MTRKIVSSKKFLKEQKISGKNSYFCKTSEILNNENVKIFLVFEKQFVIVCIDKATNNFYFLKNFYFKDSWWNWASWYTQSSIEISRKKKGGNNIWKQTFFNKSGWNPSPLTYDLILKNITQHGWGLKFVEFFSLGSFTPTYNLSCYCRLD